MLLDGRLRYAELIDAIANRFNRLGDGVVPDLLRLLRLHRQGEGTVGARTQIPLLQPVIDYALQFLASLGRAGDLNHLRPVLRIRLSYGRIGRFGSVKVSL